MKKFCKFLSVNKYYEMDNQKLELEAAKYKIGGYADSHGIIRERIIEQLLKKDEANNSRFAVFISLVALIISVVGILISIFYGKN